MRRVPILRDAMRREDFDSVSPDEAFAIEEDKLFGRQEHRNAFYNDVLQCQKAIVQVYAAGVDVKHFFFLTEFPIMVATQDGAGAVVAHQMYYSVDWNMVPLFRVPYDGDKVSTLSKWLAQNYADYTYRLRVVFRRSALGVNLAEPYIDVSTTTNGGFGGLTIDQIYEVFKEEFPYTKQSGNRYSEAFTKSEDTWPELEGLHTDYIANLGVFVPTDYKVNAVLTDLVKPHIRGKYPEYVNSFVVLDKMTFGSLEGIGAADTMGVVGGPIGAAASYIPFVGPAIGAMSGLLQGLWTQQNITQNRMFWPRLYAFGRNPEKPIVPYSLIVGIRTEYDYRANVSGAKAPIIDPPRKDLLDDAIAKLEAIGYI